MIFAPPWSFFETPPGQLIETDVPVDSKAELCGVYRCVGAGGTVKRPTNVNGPAMLFHNVNGHPDASVAIGVMGSRERVAKLFGCKKEELGHLVQKCAANPIMPVVTNEPAPAQEIVHLATDPDFDLFKLIPAPANMSRFCSAAKPSSSPLYSPSIRNVGIACKTIFDCTVPFDMKERFTRASFMEVDYKKWLKD